MTNTLHLDFNGLYPLHIDYNADGQELRISMDGKANPTPRFQRNILHLLRCESPGSGAPITKINENGTLSFHPVAPHYTIYLGDEPFATLTHSEGNKAHISNVRLLNSSQTRIIGAAHTSKAAYPASGLDDATYATRSREAMATIAADFHTHSSGQITPASLLGVARTHDVAYPIHLLKDIGLLKDDEKLHKRFEGKVTKQKRIPFTPLEPQDLPDEVECVPLNALKQEELDQLALRMALRADRQGTFPEAEYKAYRLRYPLAKDPALQLDIMKAMARESHASGIRYIDLSFVGLDNPATLREMHKAAYEIEHDTATKGMAVRFKHGIPRSITLQQFKESLDKAKILLESPYVQGIDILGYEINKSADFMPALEEFAGWMKQHRPDATLHVHAGENDKNLGNVKEILKLAERHGIKVQIGHGLYGLDDEAIAIAKRLCADPANPRLVIEANPDSNIALNNIGDLRDIPLRRMLDNGIAFVVSSDSAGLYQTGPEQLGMSLLHAGFTSRDFTQLSHWQTTLENRQRAISKAKQEAIPDWHNPEGREAFLSGLTEKLAQVPKAKTTRPYRPSNEQVADFFNTQGVELIPEPRHLPPALQDRRPITIAGASGSSWQRISEGQQRAIAIAYDMLVHAVDPQKTYFVQGRTKSEGVNEAVNNAMREVERTGGGQFQSVGLLTDPTPDSSIDYSHLSHVARIRGALDVPDTLANYTLLHNGILIVAGGAAFTRDIIMQADRRMEEQDKGLLLVMDGPEGASTDKARIMDESYRFREGKELLSRLHELNPGIFREQYQQLDDPALRKLYNDAARRINERFGPPAPTQQHVNEILPPTQERSR